MADGMSESSGNHSSVLGSLPTGCSLQTLPETRLGCTVEERIGSPHPQGDRVGADVGGCLGARGKAC